MTTTTSTMQQRPRYHAEKAAGDWRMRDAATGEVVWCSSRRQAEKSAAAAEAAREEMAQHSYTVVEIAPQRAAGAALSLWMAPEFPVSYTCRTLAEAEAVREAQKDPASWEIRHSVTTW